MLLQEVIRASASTKRLHNLLSTQLSIVSSGMVLHFSLITDIASRSAPFCFLDMFFEAWHMANLQAAAVRQFSSLLHVSMSVAARSLHSRDCPSLAFFISEDPPGKPYFLCLR